MRPECIQAVNAAIGRPINAQEARGIEDRVRNQMMQLARTEAGWSAMPRADRMTMAGQRAAAELKAEAALKKRRVQLQVTATANRLAEMQDVTAARDGRTLFDGLGEVQRRTDVAITGIRAEAISHLMDLLEQAQPRFWQLLGGDPAFAKAVVFEAFGRPTGNAEAAAGARLWAQVIEELRQRFNRAGGDVGRLDYAYFPQSHDMVKVNRAGVDAWVDAVLPKLDRSRYVDEDGIRQSDDQVREFLRAAWNTIASDGLNKLEPGKIPQGVSALVANRGSEHRSIHFAGPEGYLEYMAEFGRGSLFDSMLGHIRYMATNIGIVERWGPNAESTFNLLHDTALKSGATDMLRMRNWWVSTREVWDSLTGQASSIYQGGERYARAAERWQALRNWQVFAKLQGTLLSAISDLPTYFLTTGFNRLPLFDSTRNLLAAFTDADAKAMSRRMGLVSESLAYDVGQWGANMLRDNWTGRVANLTMKISLLNAWTDAMRRAGGMSMMGALAKLQPTAWNALDEGDRVRLTGQGVDEQTWAVWQLSKLADWDGSPMLTPEAVRALPDAVLAPFGDPARVRDQAVTKLVGLLVDESEYASIAPDIFTRARVDSFGQRGLPKGEIARTMLQFKSFPMAMVSRHWSRAIDSWQQSDGTAAKVQYVAGLAVGMTVFGGLTLLLKDIAAGRDPREVDTLKFWGAAAMSGGGFSFMGDAMYGMLSGGRGIDGQSSTAQAGGAILGPLAGTALDFADLTIRNAGQAMRGEDADFGAEAFRFVRGNTPFVNLWYTRTVLDRALLHDIQETLNPGYLSRMKQRARQDWGQEFYWQPGEMQPDRAPDFTAIGGR